MTIVASGIALWMRRNRTQGLVELGFKSNGGTATSVGIPLEGVGIFLASGLGDEEFRNQVRPRDELEFALLPMSRLTFRRRHKRLTAAVLRRSTPHRAAANLQAGHRPKWNWLSAFDPSDRAFWQRKGVLGMSAS